MEHRKDLARKMLYKYQELLDHKKFRKKKKNHFFYNFNLIKKKKLSDWTSFIAPCGDDISKFQTIIKNFNVRKVIFPKDKENLKHWLKNTYSENVIGFTIHDQEITNSAKDEEYMTSSGTIKRKEEMNKKSTKKNAFWKKNKDDTPSLLTDYN